MSIEIRVDFARKGFCLYTNGEAIGWVFRNYKLAKLARDLLLSEMKS